MSCLKDINDCESQFIVFIGRNGAGKSFTLNKMLKKNPESTIYISEEGIADIINQKNKIDINYEESKYIYIDEKSRGAGKKAEEYEISSRAKSIVEYCFNIKSKLNEIINKSQGQKKLDSIMNIFLGYNFNNINMILFDEPENFFDEEYLRVVAKLIFKLNELNYKVRISTHNSKLLSILDVSINDIILCDNRKLINVSKDEISNLFSKISNSILNIVKEEKINADSSMDYKLKLHEHEIAFESYMNYNLSSTEFYSCLFYKKILIVEGVSDKEALKCIKEKFDNTMCIYSANGKAWIPFYLKLFQMFNKEIILLIDIDDKSKTYAYALTKYLRAVDKISLVEHNPDMETEYNIDLDNIGDELGMSRNVRKNNKGWLKQLSAYYFFYVNENWRLLQEKLYPNDKDFYAFK